MAVNRIALKPSAVVRLLAAIAFLLVLASVGAHGTRIGFGHIRGFFLFDVDAERNLPTYFSVLLMLLAALLLAVIGILSRQHRSPHASKWTILSLGFVFMASDEAFQFHEALISPVRASLGGGNLGILYFAWVIPGIAVVVIVGLFFLRFLLHLPAPPRSAFTIAAILYIAGAIGGELIGGRYAERHGRENWTYVTFATAEESLEMAGLIVFVGALLRHCASHYREVRFQFDEVEENP